jgi:hypothetical protein
MAADFLVDSRTSNSSPQEHCQSVKEYGEQWEWDSVDQDYVRYTEGKLNSQL